MTDNVQYLTATQEEQDAIKLLTGLPGPISEHERDLAVLQHTRRESMPDANRQVEFWLDIAEQTAKNFAGISPGDERAEALEALARPVIDEEPKKGSDIVSTTEREDHRKEMENKIIDIGDGIDMFQNYLLKDGKIHALPNDVASDFADAVFKWQDKMHFFTDGENLDRPIHYFDVACVTSNGFLSVLDRTLYAEILSDKDLITGFMERLVLLDIEGIDIDVAAGRSYLQEFDIKSLQTFGQRVRYFHGTPEEKVEGLRFATTLYRITEKLKRRERFIKSEVFKDPAPLGYSASAKERFLSDLNARVEWLLENVNNLERSAVYLREQANDINMSKHRVSDAYRKLKAKQRKTS